MTAILWTISQQVEIDQKSYPESMFRALSIPSSRKLEVANKVSIKQSI